MADGEIGKIKDILNSKQLSVENIQSLDTRPQKSASELKAAFDQNIANLIEAIDSDDGGLIQQITGAIGEGGYGNMRSENYYTQRVDPENSEYPVDKAVYSVKALADKNGADISSTYVSKAGGQSNAISGDFYVTGKIVGGAPASFASTTTDYTLPATGWHTLESFTLAAGTYIVVGSATFSSATSVYAHTRINGESDADIARCSISLPANNAATSVQSVAIVRFDAQTVIEYQANSAQSITVNKRYFRAVRLG